MTSKLQIHKAIPGQLFIRKDGRICIFIGKDFSKGTLRYRFRLLDEHEDRKKEISHLRTKCPDSPFIPDITDELLPMTDFFEDWKNNPEFRRDMPHRQREGDWTVNFAGHMGHKNSPKNIISKY